ncbi:hypothetical protein N9545_04770 [Salibacteraceae bacterium]|nr:hypothetical protein [Salibacteraceae bacterium]MDB9708869.1 hypothetical protein [Salibacteraceae bacterium]
MFLKLFELFIGFLDVTIWPLILIVALAMFFVPLENLLNRIKSVNTPMGSAVLSEAPQSQSSLGLEGSGDKVGEGDSSLELSNLQVGGKDIVETAIDHGYSEAIFSKAMGIVLDESAIVTMPIKSENEHAFRAVEYAALIIVLKYLDMIYRDIFGGQIRILKTLNETGNSTRVGLKPHYDFVKQTYPSFFHHIPMINTWAG